MIYARNATQREANLQEHGRLVALSHHVNDLFDIDFGGSAGRSDRDLDRASHVSLRNRLHFRRHGGREHNRGSVHIREARHAFGCLLNVLFFLRLQRAAHGVHHGVHAFLEALVDHSIGFIQHDIVCLIQHNEMTLQTVQQTSGRSNQNITTVRQERRLLHDRLASHHARDSNPRASRLRQSLVHAELRQFLRVVADLLRQLARWRHHHRQRTLLLALQTRFDRRLDHVLQHRDHERARLAAARLRDADHIHALQLDRNRLPLDRRRFFESALHTQRRAYPNVSIARRIAG